MADRAVHPLWPDRRAIRSHRDRPRRQVEPFHRQPRRRPPGRELRLPGGTGPRHGWHLFGPERMSGTDAHHRGGGASAAKPLDQGGKLNQDLGAGPAAACGAP